MARGERTKLEADCAASKAKVAEQEGRSPLGPPTVSGINRRWRHRQEMLDLAASSTSAIRSATTAQSPAGGNRTARHAWPSASSSSPSLEQHNGRLQQQLDARQVELDKRRGPAA